MEGRQLGRPECSLPSVCLVLHLREPQDMAGSWALELDLGLSPGSASPQPWFLRWEMVRICLLSWLGRSGSRGTLMSVGVPVILHAPYVDFGWVMCSLGLAPFADTG